jgi:hypothetical protein
MGTSITLQSFAGVTFATFGPSHRVPIQSLIGDWDGYLHHWGDGKFPGIVAVSAIVLLTYQAETATNPEIARAFGQAAHELTKQLAGQIESFKTALDSTTHASAA